MTKWCVDANVIIAILLEEHATTAARRFWSDLDVIDQIIGPQVLLAECTSVLRRKVSEGVVSEAEGNRLMARMLSFPIEIDASRSQFSIAFAWALEMKRTKVHDLQYVAVAQIQNATIATIDGGLRQAANEHGVPVTVIR